MTKPKLYQLVQQHKIIEPMHYEVDNLIKRNGHEVLRLPPYHCHFNPIKLIWGILKRDVAQRNNTFKIADVEVRTLTIFINICEKQ